MSLYNVLIAGFGLWCCSLYETEWWDLQHVQHLKKCPQDILNALRLMLEEEPW